MNYWIFTTTERKTEEGVYKPIDIYSTRMRDAFWGLGETTPNRKNIQKGDKVIFYLGIPDMIFAGVATLSSASFELTNEQREKFRHGTQFYSSVYGVLLEDIEKWNNPRFVKELTPYLSFIENKPFWGTYFQGGIRQIPEEDFRLIVEGRDKTLVEKILSTEDIENQAEFALESQLEDFIYKNWNAIDWGMSLKLYETDGQDGRQFPAGPWSIDLLAVDEDKNDFVIIELKRGKTSDATLGQILRYMAWVKENIANPNQNVRGIIIAKDVDDALVYGIKSVSNVEIKTYKVDFHLKTY